jgi:chromosome segregation ATPase
VKDIEVIQDDYSCMFRSFKVYSFIHFACTSPMFLVRHSLQAIKDRVTSCEEESATTKERLEADIQDKRRQPELLNKRISSLNDPKGIESTIMKLDAEYEQLKLRQQREEKKNMAKLKAVTDELHECQKLEAALLNTFQKDSKMIKAYLTVLEDKCGSMREDIASLNQEVNGRVRSDCIHRVTSWIVIL